MTSKRSLFRKIIGGIISRTTYVWPDKLYLQLMYWAVIGKTLHLSRPKSFNEKLQWLKLHDRNPLYTNLVDKIAVKKWVAERIGEEYIIPTIGTWDNTDEINFDTLPEQFVLKCNHDSGGLCICTDKKTFDIQKAKMRLEKSQKRDYYMAGREWPYKNVKRRILAEKYMIDESGYELKDYKIFCFNGKAQFCKVDFDRATEHRANYYSIDWNLQTWGETLCPPQLDKPHVRPDNFDLMLHLAQQLAAGIPFARIDFYNVNNHIYFGEITFYPASGFGAFTTSDIDLTIGDLLTLPNMADSQSK